VRTASASEPTAATYLYRTTYTGNNTYANATNVVNVTVHIGEWGTRESLNG